MLWEGVGVGVLVCTLIQGIKSNQSPQTNQYFQYKQSSQSTKQSTEQLSKQFNQGIQPDLVACKNQLTLEAALLPIGAAHPGSQLMRGAKAAQGRCPIDGQHSESSLGGCATVHLEFTSKGAHQHSLDQPVPKQEMTFVLGKARNVLAASQQCRAAGKGNTR